VPTPTPTLLLPSADGIAAAVARRLPHAGIATYGETESEELADVTFYCLPYMGDAASMDLMSRLPHLRVVQSLSSGVDDLLQRLPEGVALCNGRGLYHEESTAELAVALMLVASRSLGMYFAQQQRREWRHERTDTLAGKRVLLVGYGRVGQEIESRLRPFGADVVRVSRTARADVATLDQLGQLAATADILVACIPLTNETRAIVDADVLASLPDGALVVNVARGPVVDSDALLDELQSGRLRAALDVTDPEPLPPDRPEWEMPNVFITPHIGGDTHEFARRAGSFVADQVQRHLADEDLANVVVRPAIPAEPTA
jgi:phosphoglycerate dehydrogenase-like enzyme